MFWVWWTYQTVQHVADDVAGPGSAEAGPSLRVWIQRVLRHVGQGGTSQLCLSNHLSVCLSVSLSLCLCLSLILSAYVSVCLTLCHSLFHSLWFCLSHSLPLSLSVSLCLSDSVCMSVCVSLSSCLSLTLSDSVYQQHNLFIFTDTDMFFSYSCLRPWFCAIQKVFIVIIIKWKFTQEVFVKQQYETTKWEKSEWKFWNKLGCFSGLTMGKGSSFKQQAGQMKLLSDLLSAYPKNISSTGAWPKKMQTDLIHNMANTDWPSVWNSTQNVQTMTNC